MSPAQLTEWRQRLNLNRVEAAAALGVSRNALAWWEAGHLGGKPRPIPRHIALACSAVAMGLPPYSERVYATPEDEQP